MEKLKIKLPKVIPEHASIIKVTCADKFYIGKTNNIMFWVTEFKNSFGKWCRGGINESNLNYPLIKQMKRRDDYSISIEVLFSSENGYEVLKFELEQLCIHFGASRCLNVNNVPYIPKTNRAKKGSNWLTPNQYLNFQKLLKKYSY